MHAGRPAIALMEAGCPDAELAPIGVEGALRPLLEEESLVIWVMAQRRMALSPGEALEPVPNVFGLERRLHHRIGLG